MERLQHLGHILKNPLFNSNSPADSYLHLNNFYTNEQKQFTSQIYSFLHNSLSEILPLAYDKAEFPQIIIDKFKELDIFTPFLKPPLGKGLSYSTLALTIMEIAKCDASLATFFWLQMVVNMHTLEALSTEEQKNKYLPKMAKLDLISGWALTEPEIGSDASNIQTNAIPTTDGFVINGKKRWIGNSNRDFNIVWARNTNSKKVEA